MNYKQLFVELGLDLSEKRNGLASFSPIDNQWIGTLQCIDDKEYDDTIAQAITAQKEWSNIPAPKRGEIVRQIGNVFRQYKEPLGELVSVEMGKSLQEGLGEVQEMIDICDFAVGISRQLYGLTMHSERPNHRMYEQWHPLGIVGIITAFNFPVAVWAWNAMLALVCGNVTIWKPSHKTSICAAVCQKIMDKILKNNQLHPFISSVVIGNNVGQKLVRDKNIVLISATGSTKMGRDIGKVVSERFGKMLLELGGNNAIIVTENANIDLALRAVTFGAVGTAGQRCTTTRRLFLQNTIYDTFLSKLVAIYKQLTIGNPLHKDVLVGPLVDETAVNDFVNAIQKAKNEGGKVAFGGEVLKNMPSKNYVNPCIVVAENNYSIVQEETFAPILYVMCYDNLEDAIRMQNDVPQGLSSAIFTDNLQEAEQFLSCFGSDCGIANVNIGTSGAEIGGAFGGEKETGGGRESGSDSWRQYMRRQTNTINYGQGLPLAQGIIFDI